MLNGSFAYIKKLLILSAISIPFWFVFAASFAFADLGAVGVPLIILLALLLVYAYTNIAVLIDAGIEGKKQSKPSFFKSFFGTLHLTIPSLILGLFLINLF